MYLIHLKYIQELRSGPGDFSTGLENVEPIEMNLHTIRLNMITFVKTTRNYWSGVGLPAF